VDRIRAKSFTDNVVDLMVGKLKRLSAVTQEALRLLACVGNQAETIILEIAHGGPREALRADLADAVRAGFVLNLDGSYQFAHDRIQEAAYSLIPEDRRAALHLRIGRLLLARMTADEIVEHLFDVVNQLNHGAECMFNPDQKEPAAKFNASAALLVDPDERRRVAELNLRAGRRAKASTAYASACLYLSVGMALLGPAGWEGRYDLAFGLWLERAECEFLSGNFELAEQLIAELLLRAISKIDQAAVFRLKVVLHVVKSENRRAVDSALACLRLFGIEMPAHPTSDQVQVEFEEVWRNLGERSIESLIDLPLMTDPEMLAAMAMLSDLSAPAHITDVNLVRLNTCRMVNLSLKHGTTAASTFGYAWFGVILGPAFHRYAGGFRFGQLAVNLVEKHGFGAYKAKPYLATGLAAFWTQPITTAVDLIVAAFQASVEAGDHTFACYSHNYLVAALLARGDRLDEVWEASEKGLAFARKVKFRDAADIIVGQQRLIQNMRGRTAHFSTFDDAQFDEAAFEAQLTPDRMATMVCWYWVLKIQARFMSGDYQLALAAVAKAKALLWSSDAQIHLADYHYYSALAIAATCGTGPPQHCSSTATLAAHLEQLREWADNCSAVFRDRHALVAAEVARIEGRELQAERLYEEAIRLAHEHGFIHNEGLANELAARFYAARGFEKIAHVYLRDARYCYLRWGAEGKVRQLEQLHPHLREKPAPPPPTTTFGAPVEELEIGTAVKASQALSSEIVLDKLIAILMRIAIEHAGANRGLLVLPAGDAQRIEAEATAERDGIEVCLRGTTARASELPVSIIQYVLRTLESIILEDALVRNPFSGDDYIHQKRCRSVLCLPLVRQTRLVGVLYLENNLAPHVFTPARAAMLKLLASQAAISIENARLYADLLKAEESVRQAEGELRLVIDTIPAAIWSALPDGSRNFANQHWIQYTGRPLDEGMGWAWADSVHPEDRANLVDQWRAALTSGNPFDAEARARRADGRYRWFVLRAVPLRDASGRIAKWFGTSIDIEDRKQAEARVRQAERELRIVVDTIPALVWSTLPDGSGDFNNRRWLEFTGLAAEQALGWGYKAAIHPEDFARARDEWAARFAAGESFESELRLRRADGEYRHVLNCVVPLRDELGHVVKWYGTGTDIEDRKRVEALQAELARVTRLTTMGELAASIAHEVIQPLSAVVTNGNTCMFWLEDKTLNLAKARLAAGRAIRDAERASDIIIRIRALMTESELQRAETDINGIIREVLALTRGELQKRQISVHTRLATRIPPVLADRVQLQQLMLNLIMNGIEAMSSVAGRPKELAIETTMTGKAVHVLVQDSGVGISPETAEQIFNPFFTTKPEGTGMGLAICRSIAEAHAGRIWASPGTPHGAVLQFILPAESGARGE